MINKQNNILVTALGGDIGQSIIKCLLKTEYSKLLCGCDAYRYAGGQTYLDRFEVSPFSSEESDYLNFITEIIKKYDLGYILPVNESEIAFFSPKKEYFESLGVKVLVHEKSIIEIFLDKYETIRFFSENKIQCPQTYLPGEYQGQLEFPLVIKARKSHGGHGFVIAEDQEDLDYYLRKNPESVIQKLVGSQNEEYTVGVFSDGIDVHSIAFQRRLGYGSLTKYARLVSDPEITRLITVIARACKLIGPLNIQLRKSKEGYYPLEVNPRISSTVAFRYHFGFEDIKWWLDINQDKKIIYKSKYESGIGVRIVNEAYFDLKEIN